MFLDIFLIVIVCIILILYFYYLYKKYIKDAKKSWPPEGTPAPCPDYWIQNSNGECYNAFGLSSKCNKKNCKPFIPVSSMNFNKSLSSCSGSSNQNNSKCIASKHRWSQQHNSPWFGTGPNCGKASNSTCY